MFFIKTNQTSEHLIPTWSTRFLSFPFLSIAISYMLKPMIDIFKLICYRAWITLEGNQMPLGMCHSRVFDLLYELVMIKVTACHPSKKKCKHSMKRTIPIRILLAYLMIISNPFEGTISFENSKCLHVFVSHWLTQMKNERERERERERYLLCTQGYSRKASQYLHHLQMDYPAQTLD